MTYTPGMPPPPPPGGMPHGAQPGYGSAGGYGAPPPHVPEAPIAQDVPCRKCGYNLRGLTPSMRCPECGTAVGYSFQGDLLRFCNPEWVDTLGRGAYLVVWGFVVIIAGAVLSIIIGLASGQSATTGGSARLVQQLTGAIGWIMTTVGWWLLTQPDPVGLGEDEYGTSRKIIRVALVLNVFSQVLNFFVNAEAVSFQLAITFLVIQLLLAIVIVVGFFAQLTYLKKIALRIPDLTLSGRAHFLRYAFAISYGLFIAVAGVAAILAINAVRSQRPPGGELAAVGCFALIVGLAALVFAVMYLFLLAALGRQFKDSAQFARNTWAAAPWSQQQGPRTA